MSDTYTGIDFVYDKHAIQAVAVSDTETLTPLSEVTTIAANGAVQKTGNQVFLYADKNGERTQLAAGEFDQMVSAGRQPSFVMTRTDASPLLVMLTPLNKPCGCRG